MNLADLLYETKNGQRRIKPQVVTSGIVLAVFLAFLFLLAQRQAAQSKKKANPFVTQRTFPERNLDYQIVKVDTLPFSHSTLPSEVTSSSSPFQKPAAQSPIAEPERSTRSAQREHLAPPPATTAAPRATGFNRSGSGDMIVVSSLERQPGRAGGGGFSGQEFTRMKVFLPQKTPVMNGSVIEVRVMKDESFGNLEIPRRSQLLGFCSLQNNRVQIDFREIKIRDVTYTCRGRAYDLKQLPGIAYFPLDKEAKKALWDELKSTAAGVPFVGRYLNQPGVDPFTEEVTTLEDGLEFYALIESIF